MQTDQGKAMTKESQRWKDINPDIGPRGQAKLDGQKSGQTAEGHLKRTMREVSMTAQNRYQL